MPIDLEEAHRTLNRKIQKINPHQIVTKRHTKCTEQRTLRAAREKAQAVCKGGHIRTMVHFSMGSLKGRKACSGMFQILKQHRCRSKLI